MTFCKPLEEFGDVFVFQYDVAMKHFGREGMINKLEDTLNVVNPDVIFHPTYREDIPAATWKELTKMFKTIAWHSDDNWRYDSYSREYGKNFTNSVTTYPEIYDKMDHPGRMLSQWAANTFYFKPREKTVNVSFYGQKYSNREEMLKGLDVECYGGGWENGFVPFTEMAKGIGASKIGINFSMGGDGRSKQMKLRPFEICACGTLCLTEDAPGLSDFYVIGEEVIIFKTKEELKELIDYYLEHEDERKKIATAAYERTVAKHTWRQRFEDILKVVYV